MNDDTHTSFTYTDKPHTRMTYVWAVGALVAFAVLVWAVWRFSQQSTTVTNDAAQVREQEVVPITTAQEVAYEAARAWRRDAELSKVETLESGNTQGDARAWRFVFVSATKSGTGYVIEVRKSGVVSESESPYTAAGAPMPNPAKTKDEAIAEVRAIAGYASVIVSGVEAIYNTADGVWYWGVITDKGTLSIRMAK